MTYPYTPEDFGRQLAEVLARLQEVEENQGILEAAVKRFAAGLVSQLYNFLMSYITAGASDALSMIPYVGPFLAGAFDAIFPAIMVPSFDGLNI